MSNNDKKRDFSQRLWPEDEPLPNADEIDMAAALAHATDRMLSGSMSQESKRSVASTTSKGGWLGALRKTSGVIHASYQKRELPRARRNRMIDEAFIEVSQRRQHTKISLGALWAFAVAILLGSGIFWVSWSSFFHEPTSRVRSAETLRVFLPKEQRSRSSDDLIGGPIYDRGARASRRLDRVFSSRMAGYRALRYSRWADRWSGDRP